MDNSVDTRLVGPTEPLMTSRPSHRSDGLLGPPGVLFFLATAGAIVLAVDANSRASISAFLLVAPLWLVLAGIWFLRFAGAAWTKRLRPSAVDRARWLAIPLAMGLVFAITRTTALFDARLTGSRPAMDQMAAAVMAGGSTDQDWIGLYKVNGIERTANGVRFVIDDSGLYRFGFAYAPAGQPEPTGENYDGLWCCDSYESVGDGWWVWAQSWD